MRLLPGRNFLIAGLLICLLLLFYSHWVYTIRRANNDFRNGRLEMAFADYQSAQGRIPSVLAELPAVRFPFREAILKQIQILYLQQEFEQGLELLQGLASEYPFLKNDSGYHEWYGNILFRHTILQEQPEALLDGFYATLREYQKALELDASSWDARYNYELVKQILTAEEEEGQQKLELLIDEIREKIRKDQEVPPEKRS
jgi:tetratricopeptide (TPR) repeat protein